MERGNTTHGAMRDDEMKHETEGLVHSGHSTHAEEWKDPEPAGEDQPDADITSHLGGRGVPDGMTDADVDGRSQLASYLGHSGWPMVREQIIERLVDAEAPDAIVDAARRLPAGRTFENVSDAWTVLGGHVEDHRF